VTDNISLSIFTWRLEEVAAEQSWQGQRKGCARAKRVIAWLRRWRQIIA